MRRLQVILPSLICLLVLLAGPEPAVADKDVEETAEHMSSKLQRVAQESGRPAVLGCGPGVVGDECQDLVSAYGGEENYPCLKNPHGTFPVPKQPQKFFRCRGRILSVEDCGDMYIYDSKASYCVLKKKEKKTTRNAMISNSDSEKKGPSTAKATEPPPCARGIFSELLGTTAADKAIARVIKEKKFINAASTLDRMRSSYCKKKKTVRFPLNIIWTGRKNTMLSRITNSVVREARFWRVADIPLQLVWRSPGYVGTLHDCLTSCKDRFVIAGQSTCACGSISEEHPKFDITEFVKAQNAKNIADNQGFLLHDREAFKTAVGWTCSKKPNGWKRSSTSGMKGCILGCAKMNAPYLAFGSDGCYCSPTATSATEPHNLSLHICDKHEKDGYTTLDVAYWSTTVQGFLRNHNTSVFWTLELPSMIIWSSHKDHLDAKGCFAVCTAQEAHGWVAIGMDDCKCGYRLPAFEEARIEAALLKGEKQAVDKTESQLFLLVKYMGPPQGISGIMPGKVYRDTKRTPTTAGRVQYDHIRLSRTGLLPYVSKKLLYIQNVTVPVDEKCTSPDKVYNNTPISFAFCNRKKRKSTTKTEQKKVSTHNLTKITGSRKVNLQSIEDVKGHDATIRKQFIKSISFGRYLDYDRHDNYRNVSIQEHVDYTKSNFSTEGKLNITRMRFWAVQSLYGEHKYERKTAFGQLFSIKPSLFVSCFSGAANQTLWHDLGKGPDSLNKCVCACKTYSETNKTSFEAALLQKGRCYCPTSAADLGNLIAYVPNSASCPQGTDREAYISDSERDRHHLLCGSLQKNPRVAALYPGGAGKYYEESRLEHWYATAVGMSRSAVSLNGWLRIPIQIEELNTNATFWNHMKYGVANYTHDVRLYKDVFPRTFRLLINTTDIHIWKEEFNVTTVSGILGAIHIFEKDKHNKTCK